MKFKGIDVSTWQGNINFNRVKQSGIDFVIIRAGYGIGNKDQWFEENYRKAKAAGLHVGAYWYSYADSVNDAVREAKSCISILRGKQLEYPVYFDVEEKNQLSRGKVFCSNLISAFCNELEQNGFYAGFYMSLSAVNNKTTDYIKNRYALWVAQWNNTCTYQGQYGLWQYTSHGNVPGIRERCDMNYSFIDYPTRIISGGFNGYKKGIKPIPKPTKKSINTLANEVIKGLWGNGEDRVQRLTAQGYDYKKIQTKVNQLLNPKPKKSIEIIAREVIRGDWGNGQERMKRLSKAGYNYYEIQAKVNQLLK